MARFCGEKGVETTGTPALTSPSLSHMRSSQPSSGGDSGIKSQSAPEAKPDTSARYLGGHGGGSTSTGAETQHPVPLMGLPRCGDLPAVAAHHLQHKRPLVAARTQLAEEGGCARCPGWSSAQHPLCSPLRSGGDGIDHLHDAVQRRVSTDGHVCPTEIVVDGAHQPHDVQAAVLLRHLLADLPCGGGWPRHQLF